MSFWDKLRDAMRDNPDEYGPDEPVGSEFDPDDFVEPYEPPTDLATLLNRVVQYRNDEMRDARSKAYELGRENEALKKANGLLEYERNEALQRVAKLIKVLNKKQIAALTKAPFEYRFGPPPLEILGYDEKGNYRRIPVPEAATMETTRRKGSHGGTPLQPEVVYRADQKTLKSNLDNEREQATLRQSRRGK